MYTQCPECLTIYRIVAEALAGGRGSFRCGHCESVFDALPSLVERLPLEVTGELPRHPAPMAPPLLQIPAMHPRMGESSARMGRSGPAPAHEARIDPLVGLEQPQPFPNDAPGNADDAAVSVADTGLFDAADGTQVGSRLEPAEPAGPREPGLAPDWLAQLDAEFKSAPVRATFAAREPPRAAAPTPAPGRPTGNASARPAGNAAFAARARPPARSNYAYGGPPPSAGWRWGCLLLALTLGGQVAYAERARWLKQPPVRKVLAQVLGWFGQRLPPLSDPALLSLTSRDVRPHGNVPGALLITASMRNAHDSLPIAFPKVEVKMTDLTGKAVAMRRFAPAEYLNDPSAVPAGLEPGAIVPLVFEVIDPGRNALNFEFAFRAE